MRAFEKWVSFIAFFLILVFFFNMNLLFLNHLTEKKKYSLLKRKRKSTFCLFIRGGRELCDMLVLSCDVKDNCIFAIYRYFHQFSFNFHSISSTNDNWWEYFANCTRKRARFIRTSGSSRTIVLFQNVMYALCNENLHTTRISSSQNNGMWIC